MKQKCFLFFLAVLTIPVSFQASNADSLIHVLNTQQLSLSQQISIYVKISLVYYEQDYEMLYNYSKTGMELAHREKDLSNEAWFATCVGKCYDAWMKPDSALMYYEKSVNLALKSEDVQQIVISYNDIANYYSLRGQNTKALEYYMEGLSYSEKAGNDWQSMIILSNIGGIHRILLNDNRAIYYLEKAKKIAEEKDLPNGKMSVYYDLGRIYLDKKEIDKALDYTQKTLDISTELNDKQFRILSLQALSSIYSVSFKDYTKAEEYAEMSRKEAEKYNNQRLIRDALIALSDIYFEQQKYEECEAAAVKAWEMDSTNFSQARGITHNIAFANAFMGNRAKASLFAGKYHRINREYIDKSLHDAIANTEVKYETEKKEIQIASLEKEKQIYTWLGMAGILLAASLGIVLWQTIRNLKKEKQLIATRSVMDGEMKERKRLARDLHDRLSGNLSAVKIELNGLESLLNIDRKLDICIEEVRCVAHNLMPASLQYGLKTALEDFTNRFPLVHFHFFGEEKRIEERIEFVIYCCANELVNNSLKHSGAENINLQLIQDEKHVSLTVQDDGRGYDEKALTKGLGLKNIRDRVASCNGKIDIAVSPDKGTETTIQLKIKKSR